MVEFNLLHAKALYLRFCAIYGDKFFKPYHDDEFKKIWYTDWQSGLRNIDVMLIKDSLEYCKMNLQWPPCVADFRIICERNSGIPSIDEALQLAIRRDFQHPIVAIAYEKVGSWAMKNDKEKELKVKFKSAYEEALNQFRKNHNHSFKQLEEPSQKVPLSLVHSK